MMVVFRGQSALDRPRPVKEKNRLIPRNQIDSSVVPALFTFHYTLGIREVLGRKETDKVNKIYLHNMHNHQSHYHYHFTMNRAPCNNKHFGDLLLIFNKERITLILIISFFQGVKSG